MGSGHTAVRAGGLDLALQTKALPDDIGEARKDLAQVPAGLLLQQHRRGEEADIEQGDPRVEVAQSVIERRAQISAR